MKNTLQLAIENLIHDYSDNHEHAFEKALRTEPIYTDEALTITLDGETFLPIFASVEDAQDFGQNTYVTSLQKLSFGDDVQLILNPNNESIPLTAQDVDVILDDSIETEILGADNTALKLMMQLKTLFDGNPGVSAGYLARIKTGRHTTSALAIEFAPGTKKNLEPLLEAINAWHVDANFDVFLADEGFGATIKQHIKPFYRKNN